MAMLRRRNNKRNIPDHYLIVTDTVNSDIEISTTQDHVQNTTQYQVQNTTQDQVQNIQNTTQDQLQNTTQDQLQNKKNKKIHLVPENVANVFWDTETTGRSRSRIVSIGWTYNDDHEGEVLIRPRKRIEHGAFCVHGILENDNMMEPKKGLLYFMNSILNIGKDVVMIAHNGKAFDTNVLRHELEREGVELASNIVGFVDSLHWIKYDCKMSKANIDHLQTNFLNENNRTLHGALEDSRILKRIINKMMLTHKQLGYFESRNDFFERTNKWTDSTEIANDIVEETIYKLEETCCSHIFHNHNNVLVCQNCNHWKLFL